ncbi:MAG: guanylate kinase [Oscillospiraceae bacterium]|nr:guanylate kinase [Oscillospiraceae bacterium]
MGKIICLIGKSSAGKDSLFRLLQQDGQLDLHPIITYTTRPIRQHEQDGADYHFITREELHTFEQAGKLIEKRTYQTVHGEWHYCTVDDGSIRLSEGNYLVITTLQAYESLKRFFGSNQVIPIYIKVPDVTRLERAIAREKQQQQPNYEELCRRFLADQADFSPEQLASHAITKEYENNCLRECYQQIKNDLMAML